MFCNSKNHHWNDLKKKKFKIELAFAQKKIEKTCIKYNNNAHIDFELVIQ